MKFEGVQRGTDVDTQGREITTPVISAMKIKIEFILFKYQFYMTIIFIIVKIIESYIFD